jgi:hypothetical protein
MRHGPNFGGGGKKSDRENGLKARRREKAWRREVRRELRRMRREEKLRVEDRAAEGRGPLTSPS